MFSPVNDAIEACQEVPQPVDHEQKGDLNGKRVIIVAAGYPSKKVCFDTALKLGIKLILVEHPDSWAATHPAVEHYVQVDPTDLANAANLAVRKIRELNVSVDGIVCFWENDVVLCAEIAEKLGLLYNSVEAAGICKSKLRTREAMTRAGLKAPFFHRISCESDLEQALQQVPFPAVLKPQYGADSQGATRVEGPEEARAAYAAVHQLLSVEYDAIYAHGCDCILEQYLDGDEVDVDLLLSNGKVVFWSVTDNLETNQPSFVNTGAMLPSLLPLTKQHELVDLATRTSLNAIGLTTGAIHVEMKYTSRHGPHVIEVNGRLAGNPYPQWIEAVWGVDLVDLSYQVALGRPVCPVKAQRPLCGLACTFLLNDPKAGRLVMKREDMERVTHLLRDEEPTEREGRASRSESESGGEKPVGTATWRHMSELDSEPEPKPEKPRSGPDRGEGGVVDTWLHTEHWVWQAYWTVEAGYVVPGQFPEELGWITCGGRDVTEAVAHLAEVVGTAVVPPYVTTKLPRLTAEQVAVARAYYAHVLPDGDAEAEAEPIRRSRFIDNVASVMDAAPGAKGADPLCVSVCVW